MNIVAIPPELIDIVWPQVEPLLKQVVNRAPDDLDADYQKQSLIDGNTLLVAVCEGQEIIAINILKVEEYETGLRVMYNPIIAGNRLKEWQDDALEVVIAIAKDFNCTRIRGLSVRGGKNDAWIRQLNKGKRNSWKAVHTMIELEI